jgi:beta-lactamase class D
MNAIAVFGRQIVALLCAFGAVLGMAVAEVRGPIPELPVGRQAVDATGFTGAILLYDPQRNRYEAGHAERIDRQSIPASTFKIFSSLVALETGVIDDADAIIRWDGIVRGRTELNRDLDLKTAFNLSAVPHYQELVRRIGRDRMQRFIDAVGYGNRDLSGGVDAFWLTGGLRISPREQVDFLARLYRGDLPFSQATMATVREMMVNERSARHVLRAKTGWAVLPEAENVGWWVGWVERESGVLIFATVLEATAPGDTFGPARQAVTRRVLEDVGALEAGQ